MDIPLSNHTNIFNNFILFSESFVPTNQPQNSDGLNLSPPHLCGVTRDVTYVRHPTRSAVPPAFTKLIASSVPKFAKVSLWACSFLPMLIRFTCCRSLARYKERSAFD